MNQHEIGYYIILPVSIFTVFVLGMYFGIEKPMEEHWAKVNEEIKQKTQTELTSINNMNCQQLHDKLLNSDHFYDSDNEAIARDHYVAQCGVRLP